MYVYATCVYSLPSLSSLAECLVWRRRLGLVGQQQHAHIPRHAAATALATSAACKVMATVVAMLVMAVAVAVNDKAMRKAKTLSDKKYAGLFWHFVNYGAATDTTTTPAGRRRHRRYCHCQCHGHCRCCCHSNF